MYGLNIKKWLSPVSISAAVFSLLWTGYFLVTRDISVLCITDSFPIAVNADCSGKIVILAVWAYMYITRNDFSYMRILQMKDRRQIWLSECLHILVYAAVWTAAFIMGIMLLGTILYQQGGIINEKWHGTTIQSVIIKAYALYFLQLICSILFVALTLWITNTYYPVLIILAAVCISDGHPLFYPIFYSRFTYSGNMWLYDGINCVIVLLKLILIASLLIFTGYLIAERKEFMSVDYNKK